MKTSSFCPVTFASNLTILLASLLCVVTPFSAGAAVANPPSTPQEEWSGVYLGGQKVGYGRTMVAPITYAGKPALRETSHSIQKILLLGQALEEEENSVTITDLKS